MPSFQWAEIWVGRSGTKVASFTQFHKRKQHDPRTCDLDGLQHSRSSSSAISATHRRGTTCYSVVRASPDGSQDPPFHRWVDENLLSPPRFVSFLHEDSILCASPSVWMCVCVCVCMYFCVCAPPRNCLSSLCYRTFIPLIIRLSTHIRLQSGTEINNKFSLTSTTPHIYQTGTE